MLFRSKAREQEYAVLGYLIARPRTTYAGKLRNPNPRMPAYRDLPLSRIEYKRKNEPAGHGSAHGDHGHSAPAHGEKAHSEKKKDGHTVLEAAKRLGGLS